jgi:hypothetical protein
MFQFVEIIYKFCEFVLIVSELETELFFGSGFILYLGIILFRPDDDADLESDLVGAMFGVF